MIEGLAQLVGYECSFGEQIDGLLLELKVRVLSGDFNLIVDPVVREVVTGIARSARIYLDVLANQLYHGGDVRGGNGAGLADGVFGSARICLARLIRIADGKPSWTGDIPWENQEIATVRPDALRWLPNVREAQPLRRTESNVPVR